MNSKSSSYSYLLLLLFLLAILSITSNAFDINKTLSNYPQLGAFNGLLSQTHLLSQIDRQSAITILALDNTTITTILRRDKDEMKKILSTHLVLDYYDLNKLQRLPNNNTLLTTLLQTTTAQPSSDQGFLSVTQLSSGDIVFGSADKNARPVAKLLKSVYCQPSNVSVLQVSLPIVAPGVGEVISAPPPPPYTPPPARPPKHSNLDGNDVDDSPSPSTDSDPSSEYDPADAPARSSRAKAPAPPKEGEDDGGKKDSSRDKRVTSGASSGVMNRILKGLMALNIVGYLIG